MMVCVVLIRRVFHVITIDPTHQAPIGSRRPSASKEFCRIIGYEHLRMLKGALDEPDRRYFPLGGTLSRLYNRSRSSRTNQGFLLG